MLNVLNSLQSFLENEVELKIMQRGAGLQSNISSYKIKEKLDACKITSKVEGSSGEDYKVKIDIDEDGDCEYECECAYYEEYYLPCKHIAALAIYAQKPTTEKEEPKPQKAPKLKEPQNMLPPISMDYTFYGKLDSWNIGDQFINAGIALKLFRSINSYFNPDKPVELENGKRFELEVVKEGTKTFVSKLPQKNTFTIGCNCITFKAIKPCQHIGALMLYVNEKKGWKHWRKFEDETSEKNKLLAPFGLTLENELAKDFVFDYDYYDNLEIKTKPSNFFADYNTNDRNWIYLLSKLPVKKKEKKSLTEKATEVEQNIANNLNKPAKPEDPFDVGLLFNLNQNALEGFRIDALKITSKGDKESIKQVKLKSLEDVEMFNNFDPEVKDAIAEIIEDKLIKELKAQANYYHSTLNSYQLQLNHVEIINGIYKSALQQMANELISFDKLFYLPDGAGFAMKNLVPCKYSNEELKPKIKLFENQSHIWLEIILENENEETLQNFTFHNFLLLIDNVFYNIPELLKKLLKFIPNGKIIIPISSKVPFLNEVVIPLSTKYTIDFGDVFKIETVDTTNIQPRLFLSELNEKYLMITPSFLYDEHEVENNKEKTTTLTLSNSVINIVRKREIENEFTEKLKQLHPKFSQQNNEYFYLHFDDVMRGNWFLSMYTQLQELNVPVFGMNNLKKFNYNKNKPTMGFKTSSGTDWFDLQIEVSYGDQVVPLQALRKAIINKQQFILLGDRTLGMLPDEWIKKFATIMRMGTVDGEQIKVSKMHWTIVDSLHEQITDATILQELETKKQALKNIEDIKEVKLPINIKANLRDYQKVGFQWMNMLDNLGWGGCLADDMGLGKTLQTLSFISQLQKKYKNETHLIVCPTSLIYNWESEIQKFTPHLKYHIHYGSERDDLEEKNLKKHDIVITSYGILRSDIEQFNKAKFGYIILDESQAIKNHLSQIAKAVQLVKCRNKLILSGTPVQNNTFDLYSQFNFINPGLLGNIDFFKTEFANAIDRDNNKDKTEELRKIIYPFILRRTKEQVAKDLPEKTETILWCEMEKEQRKIYNSFKDYYRKAILEKIEKEGFGKAGMFILSGLTKLRQICDSPAILNEDESYPNVSIKIDELLREVEENSSNHKALIFSQFTTMLDLIGKELTKRKIKFYYLDGGTAAEKRKEAVANFQNNEDVKIFLISLKAGGVGLNLTSADYVYLVDPWWNPAVEQQAIDRTHRIGQTKNVFAYKLICKDSIEEKIIKLQEKKKALSADLISDENGFVKKLTKDDVAYLFS